MPLIDLEVHQDLNHQMSQLDRDKMTIKREELDRTILSFSGIRTSVFACPCHHHHQLMVKKALKLFQKRSL